MVNEIRRTHLNIKRAFSKVLLSKYDTQYQYIIT